ncbi:hypothetical protein PFLG_00441 [Plasmodium falciparum RAJ116]|uniref:Uncharacterized protein n=1 Tax=Plasmodium falciparum RAJ116 TaxID=580058 RepID=A0A0L0CSX8_PLAFA|nr:hypothetical protein PFLG_00441 [Plasmodium falciparum RAJ116]
MSDNYQFLQFYNVYKDNRNKWGKKINKLNFNLDHYKSSRTKIFLYTLWYSIIFTYLMDFFFNLLFFFLYMPYTNIISKTIFFLSILDCIFVIILTCRSFYAYSYDKSKSLHTLKIQYILSCIRTSTILKSKIRKDLEKQSFLFDDYTYGTFLND